MRKNGTFGGSTEVQVYSIISKLKIEYLIWNLQEINEFKANDSDPINCCISGKKIILKFILYSMFKKRITKSLCSIKK